MNSTPTAVTLTNLVDPSRKIAAIKALREASRPAPSEKVTIDLIGAKLAVDSVLGNGMSSGRHIAPSTPTPTPVLVYDVEALKDAFYFDVVPSLDRELVLDFVMDVLSIMDFDQTRKLGETASFETLRATL
jgi:hypothetical protein